MAKLRALVGALAAMVGLLLSSAQADDLSTIGQGAFSDAHGIVQVNVAAGEANTELNAATLLKSASGVGADSNVLAEQQPFAVIVKEMGELSASIEDQSFQNASGLIMVNVLAGTNNSAANAASIITGGSIKPASDRILAQEGAPSDSAYIKQSQDASRGKATVDDSAFTGASGVIQVNVAAGSGNRLVNELALNVGVGARP